MRTVAKHWLIDAAICSLYIYTPFQLIYFEKLAYFYYDMYYKRYQIYYNANTLL